MVTITALGNCATQTPERNTTGFLVDAGGFRILIDSGPAVVRQLQRTGTRMSDIDVLIVTHAHADHSAGYPYFLFSAYTERLMGADREGRLHVIALPEVHDGLACMFRFQYPPGYYDEVPIEVLNANASDRASFTFPGCSVTTIPVDHAVPNIGIRIDFPNSSIAFSGDTLYSPSFVNLAQGADILFHEGFCAQSMASLATMTKHSTARDAGRAAQASESRRLVLTHLLAPAWRDANALVIEASQEFDGPIVVLDDLESVTCDY